MFNRYGLMVLPVVDAERVPFAPVVLKLRDQSGLICIIKSFSADFFKILDPDGKFYNRSHTMGLLFSINKILCLFMVCLLFLSFCAGRFCSLQISESIIIYAWTNHFKNSQRHWSHVVHRSLSCYMQRSKTCENLAIGKWI